jgi:hypothetical protein
MTWTSYAVCANFRFDRREDFSIICEALVQKYGIPKLYKGTSKDPQKLKEFWQQRGIRECGILGSGKEGLYKNIIDVTCGPRVLLGSLIWEDIIFLYSASVGSMPDAPDVKIKYYPIVYFDPEVTSEVIDIYSSIVNDLKEKHREAVKTLEQKAKENF